jgi:ubiquinol oxidase
MNGNSMSIDLKKEQEASRERPRYKYSISAKIFFWTMDFLTGKKVTPAKAKLIETLASIPYRSWEFRQYARMTRGYRKDDLVKRATSIMDWGRDAQDNEYWHLRVINEKMKQDGIKDAWYLFPLIPWIMVLSYAILTRFMAVVNIRRAFLFNAEFEDHAEHVYAQFVDENPGLDDQPVDSKIADQYMEFASWGDVFRRIGLDERDHMNNSFVFCGKPECVVEYEGMPPLPDVTS